MSPFVRTHCAPIVAAGLTLLTVAATPAWAAAPPGALSDPALEARARQVGRELRCVVCQNQSIDDSNAPLALDLRALLRERLAAGDSDTQAKAFLVARYGNFVLLKPPFQLDTLLLWLGPVILSVLGGLGFRHQLQRAPGAEVMAMNAQLSADDERRVSELLKDGVPS